MSFYFFFFFFTKYHTILCEPYPLVGTGLCGILTYRQSGNSRTLNSMSGVESQPVSILIHAKFVLRAKFKFLHIYLHELPPEKWRNWCFCFSLEQNGRCYLI